MNNNDRINAYKHAFNFKEKLSSEEVAKNNAAIESMQKPKTDAALAALLASSHSEPEEEEKPEFKPFSFDNAPVFKSIDDGADTDKNQNQQKQEQQNNDNQKKDEPPEEEDFWHQRDAMLKQQNQSGALNLPSITPPPKPQVSEAEPKNEAQTAKTETVPTSSASAASAYKPVPYVPSEPVAPSMSFEEQIEQRSSAKDSSDFRSSPEFQAFLRETGRGESVQSKQTPASEVNLPNIPKPPVNAQPSTDVNSPDYKPVPYVAPEQAVPQQPAPVQQPVQSQPQQTQQMPSQYAQPQNVAPQPQYTQPQQPLYTQTQYAPQQFGQPVQQEKPKKRGFFEQLFGIKTEQNPPVQPQYGAPQTQYAQPQYTQPQQPQYTQPQQFQPQNIAAQQQPPQYQPQANSAAPNTQNPYSAGMRAQAYTAEKSRDLQQPVPQVVKRTAIDTSSANPSPVREFDPPPETNQFDFAAFAAKTGRPAFQPKKFEAQPLENMYKKSADVQKVTKPSAQGSNILYKIPSKDSACRRVAKFLLLIGVDEAAKVIALLPSDLIDKIIPEIASVRRVDPDEAEQIIAEFSDLYEQAKEGGGVSTARTILEKAFGDERAQEMMQKAVPFEGGKPFEYLKDLDGEQMATILKDESAPVRALVLSQVKPAVAAAVINQMDEEERKETIRRLAKLTTFPPDILGRIDHTMREKAQNLKTPKNNRIDGRGALANILRKMDASAEKNILSNLSLVDTELESDLRKRLFTLDDVIDADDRYLQKKLHSMSDMDIAVLICGKSPEFRKKILSNISKSRGAIVLDEEEARKPIRKRDSEEMTNKFVAALRAAWEAGDLSIGERSEDEWVN
ncbi:MAG: flagellar motor switch protein FliG [Spirochaetaceae bacterium]|nr:flagellar motor switch protein FliG [Spirochaetaceae bacterium]